MINDNYIKIKMLYKFSKIKWLDLHRMTVEKDNL